MRRKDYGESQETQGIIYERIFNGVRIRLSRKLVSPVYLPVQRHTDTVIKLTSLTQKPEVGDSVITNLEGVEIGIKTADCVPIALVGENWVGVIHAGWRGLYKGIIPKTIEAMRKEGEKQLYAFVFPSAKACCYEVGPEFKSFFSRNLIEKNGKLFFDPQEEAILQLQENGVKVVEVLRDCTICNLRYPSYRRDKTEERIFTSVIKLSPYKTP